MLSYGSACLARCSVSERSTLLLMKHQMLCWRTRPKWQLPSSKISGHSNKKYVCNTTIFLKKAQNRHSQELRMFFKTGFFHPATKERKEKNEKNQKATAHHYITPHTSCWSHLLNKMLRIAVSNWEGCMFSLPQGKFWNSVDVFSVKQFFINLML